MRTFFALLSLALVVSPSRIFAAPQRIVDAWYAHNATLVMLGAASRVVATSATPDQFPWMYRVAPTLYHATRISPFSLNGEEMLRLRADLVFIPQHSPFDTRLRELGLNVVSVGFTSYHDLLRDVAQTADVLDTPEAQSQAKRYVAALRALLTAQRSKLKANRSAHAMRVLHIASLSPLLVDGDNSLIDAWINLSGGTNAARGLHGNLRRVTREQVLAWAPDIIIVGAAAGQMERLLNDPLLKSLKAVRYGRIYRNPAGVFAWDRYGPETLLQLIWARQIISKGHIDQQSMMLCIQNFYQQFYRYRLSSKEAARILAGEPPKEP